MPGHTGLRQVVQDARRVSEGRDMPAQTPVLLLLPLAGSQGSHVSHELSSVLLVKLTTRVGSAECVLCAFVPSSK
jgi:hypothetical protein